MAVKNWVGTDSGNEGAYSTAANWSPSGVPLAGDSVIIANSSQNILTGLDQSAVALADITIDASYTGVIGTTSADFLQVATAVAVLGQKRGNTGTFTGSKRLNLDLGSSTAAQVTIYSTANSGQDQNRTPLRLQTAHASTDLFIESGSVSLSDESNNSSTVGDVTVYGGSCTIGEGVTLSNVIMTGGTLSCQSSIATLASIAGGTLNQYDDIAATTIATLTISSSGSVNHYASGTITTLNLNGGTCDLTKTKKAKTVTTVNMNAPATLITDTNVTLTNDVALASAKLIISTTQG
jgi:hypothetical protein